MVTSTAPSPRASAQLAAPPATPRAPAADVAGLAQAISANVERVVRGKSVEVTQAVVTLLAGGHLLVEDLPGLGKTTLAKALAKSIGGSFKRVQATADLLPTELTGVNVFQPATSTWEFRPGPLFANVVLVDELNRATPRAQSALLEAMAERQVTVDGTTYALPTPHLVVATQNPFDHAGTFPLVEGQRDRFLSVLSMGHPARESERELLLGNGGDSVLSQSMPVCDSDQLLRVQAAVRAIHLHPAIADYVISIGEATRAHVAVSLGLSPRGALALTRASQSLAAISGRDFVSPADIQTTARYVIPHRLVLVSGGSLNAAREVVESVLATVATPRG